MRKLEYTSESTFITEEVEFSDEHVRLAENIHGLYKSEFLSKCSPLMVRPDKESLVFLMNLGDRTDRVAYERGDNMYKIIIEKIKN